MLRRYAERMLSFAIAYGWQKLVICVLRSRHDVEERKAAVEVKEIKQQLEFQQANRAGGMINRCLNLI